MEELDLKDKTDIGNNDKKYAIIATLKNGNKERGVLRYRTADDAHRYWFNICKFVPLAMKKFTGYEVVRIDE